MLGLRVLRNGERAVLGPPSTCTDRFMIEGDDEEATAALVERHRLRS